MHLIVMSTNCILSHTKYQKTTKSPHYQSENTQNQRKDLQIKTNAGGSKAR